MKNDTKNEMLKTRAKALKLYGILEHWDEISILEWVKQVIEWEEVQGSRFYIKTEITGLGTEMLKLSEIKQFKNCMLVEQFNSQAI
jgi:hypothetical protein